MHQRLPRGTGKVESVGTSGERYVLFRHARAPKPRYNVVLDAPRHRTYEAFRRGRGIRGADFQYLRDQRWIIRDPVPHDDPTTGSGDADHLLSHVIRLWREHGYKDAHHEVKAVIFQLLQI